MKVKEIYDKLSEDGYFQSVEVSKDIPDSDLLKKMDKLPALFLLPVISQGEPPATLNARMQTIHYSYGFALIVPAGDIRTAELELTTAREQLLKNLLGFTIDGNYSGLSLKDGALELLTTRHAVWVETWITNKTHRIR